MRIKEALQEMDDPRKDCDVQDGTMYEVIIGFLDKNKMDDETSFDIDCDQDAWKSELEDLWLCFCEENGFASDSVTDVKVIGCCDDFYDEMRGSI